MQKKVTDHDKEIDWQRVGDLAHTPRAVPVPITGSQGGIEDVIGKSLLVQNTVPKGSNWDGKIGAAGGRKDLQGIARRPRRRRLPRTQTQAAVH